MLTEGDRQMLSMQLSNIPFYVLERQKCVNVRNICPSRMIVGFSGIRQRILQGEGTNSGWLSWDPCQSYVYIALYLAAKFITFPGKIQNLAAKLSNIGTHKIGRNSILNWFRKLYAKILETDWVISILMWLILQISRTEIFGGIFIRYRAIG